MMRQNLTVATSACHLFLKLGIPPHMININGDACAVSQPVTKVERLLECVETCAICGIKRMKRLDG
ncbi:hypothetical protein D3C72_2455360 [compost metagenome]